MSKVMIYTATYENVRIAVDKAFEVFPISIQGKKVLIKPNVLRASDADEGIVTNPAVLRAVVEKVEEFGGGLHRGGGQPGRAQLRANEKSFQKTGLLEAAKGYYQNIGNESQKVPFNPEYMPTVSVSSIVMQADVVISLPKFKTHGLTVITGAIKNSFGILPGGPKGQTASGCRRAERFHEVIVEVFRLRPPDLFIVDAVVGMEGNGPASPDIRDIGLVLASDNAVALDAVIATMMGCDPGRLGFLQKAKELGLGDYDLDKNEILGELKPLPDFKIPPLGGEAIHRNEANRKLIYNLTLLRPRVDQDSCTACGTCIDHCTASALSMQDGFPEVDPEKCIVCFCCQEMCPEKAITLQ